MLKKVESEIFLAEKLLPTSVTLPHVSLVVTNWNYGSYIGDTLKSICDQTYPWRDCLIVDNGSTDNSLDVIRDHIGDDPRFTVVALDRNYGQLGAGLKVMNRLKGEFVCFIDADDILFPDFIATHIQAHLGAIQIVSLTSSNLIEIDSTGQLLNGGLPWFARSDGIKGFRPGHYVPKLPMLSDDERRDLAESCSTFPWSQQGWLWGPGTSNMYRRSVIEFLLPDADDETQFGGFDCYLNYFAHALTGSCVINKPLSAYRIHGRNDFSNRASLSGLVPGMPHNQEVDNDITTRVGRLVVERAETIGYAIGPDRFWDALDVIGFRPFRSLADYHRSLMPAYIKSYPKLVELLGEKQVACELCQRIGYRAFLKLFRAARPDRHPAVALMWAFGHDVRYRRRRARNKRAKRLKLF